MTLCTFGGRFAKTPKAGQPVELLQVDDWKAVFEARHDFDAHAWPYVRYLDGELAPAVRMGASAGKPTTEGDALCSLIFLDYDESNDHHEVLERFASVEEGPLPDYAAIYPTKSGMRFVYRLTEPVLYEEYGQLARGLALELFARTGLRVDSTTDQWFRCFRLPNVRRSDGKAEGATWEQDYYFEPILTDTVVDPDKLPHSTAELPWKKGRAAKPAGDRPDNDTVVPDGRLRIYKRVLRSSRFKDYVFDGAEVMQGRRDETLMAMAAETVGKCYFRVPESTPSEIFALLLPVALRMDSDGEPWEDKLWRMVQHCWNGEVDKEKQRAEKSAADRSMREVVFDALFKNLPAEVVPNDPAERFDFALSHLFLQYQNGVYPLQADGTYTTLPIMSHQVTSYLNSNGLLSLSPDGFRTDKGKLLSSQEILNRNSSIIHEVTYEARLDKGVSVRVGSQGLALSISPFGLDQDLVERAEIDPDIESWLNTFPDPAKLKLWLASALAINRGPTSALYLMGPARVGKSMLGMALAECFGALPVSGAQAFDDYNGALMRCPIVLADEGLPRNSHGVAIADQFRTLITGSGASVHEKYRPSVQFNVPFRILFAANSFDMVRELVGDRPLTGDDKKAFEERMLVVACDRKPADFLDRRGGMAFTKNSPKGAWIGGEQRLARHLIRLYQLHFEEHEFTYESRMLVPGEETPALSMSFDMSGLGAEVVDLLSGYVTDFCNGDNLQKVAKCLLRDDKNRIFARKIPLLRLMCYGRNAARPGFDKALERLFTNRRVDTAQGGMAEIDVRKLQFYADASGLETQTLKELLMEQAGIA